MVLGLLFLKRGFPTHESVKKMIQNLARKTIKTKKDEEEEISELNKKIEEQLVTETNSFNGFISRGSRLFYILALVFGILIGFNSGLFGASSGLIFVLTLVILYGYPLKKGVGTALILSIIIGSCTFLFYQILGLTVKGQLFLHFELSLYLAIGSVISGIITSIYVQKISAKTMGRAVGFIIFILGSLSLAFFFIT